MSKNVGARISLRPRFMGVIYFKSASRRIVTRRVGDAAELIVMLGGTYRAWEGSGDRRKMVQAGPGEAVYWPAGAERTEENDPAHPTQCYCVYLAWPRAPQAMARKVRDSSGTLRHLTTRLVAVKESPVVLPAEISNAFLAALMGEYLRLSLVPDDPLVVRVVEFLNTHRDQPFRLTELARFVGLDRYHLGRIFKAKTGYSPMDYVRRKRIEHALGMFTSGNFDTRVIATRVGIPDEAEFRRVLKRYTGLGIRAIRRLAPKKRGKSFVWEVAPVKPRESLRD